MQQKSNFTASADTAQSYLGLESIWQKLKKNSSIQQADIYEPLLQNLKTDINEFLYDKVHKDMTMQDFQLLSISIYDLILSAYESHKDKK